MTKKLQHLFALSEKGAKDLVKAIIWCFICNLSLMLPVGAVLFTVQHLLDSMEKGSNPADDFWIYAGFGMAVLVMLFVLHWFQYASLYLATYKESANRRVSLAETLRRLPLSFFGNRNLSDLTSTMIAVSHCPFVQNILRAKGILNLLAPCRKQDRHRHHPQHCQRHPPVAKEHGDADHQRGKDRGKQLRHIVGEHLIQAGAVCDHVGGQVAQITVYEKA